MNKYFPKLFEPLTLKNGMVMKNRIVTAPTQHSGLTTTPPDNYFNHNGEIIFGERIEGGAAIVTLGEGKMDAVLGFAHDKSVNCYKPETSAAFMKFTALAHGYDCLASIEFNHGGHFAKNDPVSASAFMTPQGWFSREITEQDMDEIADMYANACSIAVRSGFDIACIHLAHGWLLGGFLSPIVNKRTDQYGGSIENRCRFPLMIFERIRQKVGNKLALEVRMSGDEYTEGGLTIDDVVEIAKLIEPYVDLIQISCGTRLNAVTRAVMHPSHFVESGHIAPLAKKVKEAVHVPVGCVGAIDSPELAEKLIEEGSCDYVVMARSVIADPNWPEKARHGQAEDIRPCIRCFRCLDISTGRVNTSTTAVLDNPSAVTRSECSVNPVFGDHMLKQYPAPKTSKKVVVIGGGVAGMQAAITAAERGHRVVLYEKGNRLGGQLFYADYVWFKQEMKRYREYLIKQVEKAAITVKLNTEATPALVEKEYPDAVLVAVGAESIIPPIKGVSQPNVTTAVDMYDHEDKLGNTVAIIGGGMVGCETALHLTHLGHKVVLVEMGELLAPEGIFTERIHTLQYMDNDPNLSYHTATKCVEITEKGIKVVNSAGEESLLEADSIVLSAGLKPRKDVCDLFEDSAFDVFYIGDCKKVGTVYSAVHNGYNAASRI